MRTGICGEEGARSNISKGLVGDSDEGGRLMPYVGLPVWGFDPYARVTYGSLESWSFDPYARYGYGPVDRGWLAENIPGATITGQALPTVAGRLEFAKIRLPVAQSVTNVIMYVQAGGSALTAGQCFAALYTGAGARVGVTADQSTGWASTGLKTMALASGPFACPSGDYYVAFWYNGTTSPTWLRGTGIQSAFTNAGTAAPNLMCGFADTGLTTTAPASMGAQSAAPNYWWAALS